MKISKITEDLSTRQNGSAIQNGFDDLLDEYVSTYTECHSRDIDNIYILEHASKSILDLLKRDYSMLYVGCGTSGFLKLFKHIRRFVGIDYSHKMIEASKIFTKTLPIESEFICSTFENYSKKESFDIIALIVYGYYLPITREILNKAKGLLNEDGIIVCPVFDPHFTPILRFKEMVKTLIAKKTFHYDPIRNAERLFKECNLEIIGGYKIQPAYCKHYLLKKKSI